MPKKTIISALVVVFVAAALWWLSEHRGSNLKSPCLVNMESIETWKLNWMTANDKTLNDTPSWADLKPYMGDAAKRHGWKDGIPVCPEGGVYTVGRVGEWPRCSIHGTHDYPPLHLDTPQP